MIRLSFRVLGRGMYRGRGRGESRDRIGVTATVRIDGV